MVRAIFLDEDHAPVPGDYLDGFFQGERVFVDGHWLFEDASRW